MWRAARIVAAGVVTSLFVFGFINLRNLEPAAWEHLVERLQFVPALLGSCRGVVGSVVVVVVLLTLTLLFGRVYCSFICPLGILQDVVIRLRRGFDKLHGRKRSGATLRFAQPLPWLRYTILSIVILSFFLCGTALVAWLDPYSICARLMAGMTNPLAATAKNLAAGAVETPTSWGRYGWLLPAVVGVALVPLALAWWRGRIYCNTICPVGAFLALLSRAPLFRLGMNPSACVHCANCVRACKAQCIDLRNYRVDTTRCINCYDCVSACEHGLRPKFTFPFRHRHDPENKVGKNAQQAPPSASRRAFLGLLACSASALAASGCREQETLPGKPGEPGDNQDSAVTPPGSRSVPRFLDTCTACGLCITACPTQVLQPSSWQYGLSGMLKPRLDFTVGFCNFDCNICGRVCPDGAIMPLDLAEKQRTQIALAEFHRDRCIVQQHYTECGACTEHCPTKALSTEEGQFPSCNASLCLACNACVETCPQKAISLVGDEQHGMHAQIDRTKCIACGKCSRVCPSGAMTSQRLLIPVLKPELCIGCGACTYACPVRPERAMQVTGRHRHLLAEVVREKPAENPVSAEEFPF